MKSRILVIALVVVALFSVSQAYAWDASGHGTIGHIADQHLTPKARKMCNKYLGHSLAYYASWLDNWRYSHEYHHTARWHAVGIKDGKFFPGQMAGDIADFLAPLTPDDHGVARMEQLLEQLKDYRNMPDSAVAVNLKCIIHMVGDMHCPGHVFYYGLKQYEITDNGEPSRFHGHIDKCYSRYNRGKSSADFYDKYCRLTKEEIAALQQGTLADWIIENTPLFKECYTLLSPTIDYKDLPEKNKFRLKEITDELRVEAGFRLAYTMNQIFK